MLVTTELRSINLVILYCVLEMICTQSETFSAIVNNVLPFEVVKITSTC